MSKDKKTTYVFTPSDSSSIGDDTDVFCYLVYGGLAESYYLQRVNEYNFVSILPLCRIISTELETVVKALGAKKYQGNWYRVSYETIKKVQKEKKEYIFQKGTMDLLANMIENRKPSGVENRLQAMEKKLQDLDALRAALLRWVLPVTTAIDDDTDWPENEPLQKADPIKPESEKLDSKKTNPKKPDTTVNERGLYRRVDDCSKCYMSNTANGKKIYTKKCTDTCVCKCHAKFPSHPIWMCSCDKNCKDCKCVCHQYAKPICNHCESTGECLAPGSLHVSCGHMCHYVCDMNCCEEDEDCGCVCHNLVRKIAPTATKDDSDDE